MNLLVFLFLTITTRLTNCYTIDYFDCTTPKSTKIYDLNNLCEMQTTNNSTKQSYQLLVSFLKENKKKEKRINKKKEGTNMVLHISNTVKLKIF